MDGLKWEVSYLACNSCKRKGASMDILMRDGPVLGRDGIGP